VTANGSAPRVGAGDTPALLLVDFARGWTDPRSPLSVPCADELEAAAKLLSAARTGRVPVVFTTVAYDDSDADTVLMLRKTPRVRQMRDGSPLTHIDPRLTPLPEELVLTKKHASAFFGTPLESHLAAHGVDTVVIGGLITSGCVRTTAVDAAQYGYRALVVSDATTDRSSEARDAALRTIDDLYGDVVTLAEAEEVLGAWG
jgi:maleamate amidohydrolase